MLLGFVGMMGSLRAGVKEAIARALGLVTEAEQVVTG